MNKKSIIDPTLAILVIFIYIYAFYIFVASDQGLSVYQELGKTQINLMNNYNQAEKDHFYTEQAIKYSLYNATYKFVKTAGIEESCHGIWKFNTNCDPDLNKNFINLFADRLQDYDYKDFNTNLKKDLILTDFPDKTYYASDNKVDIEYKIEMKFKQDLQINIDEIITAENTLRECVNKGQDLTKCLNYKHEIRKDDFGNEIIYYTIENNKNSLIITDKDKLYFRLGIDSKNSKAGDIT